MLPRDANPHPTSSGGAYSTVFGGVILSHIDLAGAVGARRAVQLAGGNTAALIVTVAINRVEFKRPVLVGDVVKFYATTVRHGRTSVTMNVSVVAERGSETIPVTEAELVYVGVDPSLPDRPPTPLGLPAADA
jgi:acyl-CoA thioesterase YciA